jgi:hypothetical protein
MNEDYKILYSLDTSSEEIQNQVFSVWREFIKSPIPKKLLEKRLSNLSLAVLHRPTNKVIGFTTSSLKFYPSVGKNYYFVGLIVSKGYPGRPFLLDKTFTYLQENKSSEAAGVAITRKNKRISDKILERYSFFKVKGNTFLRDFE